MLAGKNTPVAATSLEAWQVDLKKRVAKLREQIAAKQTKHHLLLSVSYDAKNMGDSRFKNLVGLITGEKGVLNIYCHHSGAHLKQAAVTAHNQIKIVARTVWGKLKKTRGIADCRYEFETESAEQLQLFALLCVEVLESVGWNCISPNPTPVNRSLSLMFSRPATAPEARTTARKSPPTLPNTTNTEEEISSEAHAEASKSAAAEAEAVDGEPEAPASETKTEEPEHSKTTPEGETVETNPENDDPA